MRKYKWARAKRRRVYVVLVRNHMGSPKQFHTRHTLTRAFWDARARALQRSNCGNQTARAVVFDTSNLHFSHRVFHIQDVQHVQQVRIQENVLAGHVMFEIHGLLKIPSLGHCAR